MDILAEASEIVARRMRQHELERQILLASLLNERRITKQTFLEEMNLVDYDILAGTKQCSVVVA